MLTRGYLQTILLLNNITVTFRGEGSGLCDGIASLFYMQTSLEQLNTMVCYYLRKMSEDINDFIDVGMRFTYHFFHGIHQVISIRKHLTA